jgi:hypothetical protein
MTLVVLPYPLIKPGDPKDITQVMANFNAISAVVNGQLADDNIAPSANIDQAKITSGYQPSRLGREGALTNQGLVWDQTNAKWSPQYTLPSSTSRTGTNLQIANSTTETAVVSFTVGAGALSTNRILVVRMGIGIYNNTGSQQSITFRVKYGSTTLFSHTPSFAASAQTRAGVLSYFLSPANSTIAQRLNCKHIISQDPIAIAAGIGDLTQSGGTRTYAGSSSENSSTALTFQVTMQMISANAQFIINRGWYWAAIFS